MRELDAALAARGGGLVVRHASARDGDSPRSPPTLGVDAVYANHDYEPAACDRDAAVAHALAAARHRVPHVQGPGDLRARRGADRRRQAVLGVHALPQRLAERAHARPPRRLRDRRQRRRARTGPGSDRRRAARAGSDGLRADQPRRAAACNRGCAAAPRSSPTSATASIAYREARDYPAVKGPSYLSVHLRFGTVSVRELAAYAHACSLQPDGAGAATWLSELIWREFYAQILWHHPQVVDHAFKPEYDALAFPNDPAALRRVVRRAAPATRSSTRRCAS